MPASVLCIQSSCLLVFSNLLAHLFQPVLEVLSFILCKCQQRLQYSSESQHLQPRLVDLISRLRFSSFLSSCIRFNSIFLQSKCCYFVLPCLLVLSCLSLCLGKPGSSEEWEFTFRPRAGDSGREKIDVVEDYLGYFPSPDGQGLNDILFTSGGKSK